MSTTKNKLEYLWTAIFDNGHVINQPLDDKYSKHDDNAEHNKSAFQDILDYQENHKLNTFMITDGNIRHSVYLDNNKKLIYYRDVEIKYIDGIAQEPNIVSYNVGYEYKDENGKNIKRITTIYGS